MMKWPESFLTKLFETAETKSGHEYSVVMILAGEPSGDLHGADLVRQMRSLDSRLHFVGMGGPKMEQAGVYLFFSIDQLSAMGFVEVLWQLKQIQQAFRSFRRALKRYRPDLLVLVDYPGFNLKAAEYAKKHDSLPVLYYIAPKVWAWKKSRLVTIRKFVDHVALIFPFETAMYKKARIPASYVGNPLVDHLPATVSWPDEKSRLSIGLLPGSRPGEVKKLLAPMLEAAGIIKNRYPDCRFLISRAVSISEQDMNDILVLCQNRIDYEIVSGQVDSIWEKSHMVIAASGTVTLEAALRQVPCVLVYKISPVSYQIARRLVTVKYAGLANLIADEPVMPELIQENASPQLIAAATVDMLKTLDEYREKLGKVRQILGDSGAAKRTARIGLDLIKKTGRKV